MSLFKSLAGIRHALSMRRYRLREFGAADSELNDALLARVALADSRLHGDASRLIAEWDAVEKSGKPRKIKEQVLRLLFRNLAMRHADATRSADGQAGQGQPIVVEISSGEIIDRLTILEIKLERIGDAAKLKNVRHEYELLSASVARLLPPGEPPAALRDELKAVNGALWDIEDQIRDRERAKDFGEAFVALARLVYRTNDRRAALKRQINDRLKSAIVEEKSYAIY